MKKLGYLMVALVVLGMSGAGAFAQPIQPGVGIMTMTEQNGSGQNGTVSLEANGSQMTVTINISGGSSTPQPAHIHKGFCANLDPVPFIPLNSVINGQSVTTVNMSLGDFMSGDFAINVHKSVAEGNVYVSCADKSTLSLASGLNPGMPTTGNGDQLGLWALAIVGVGLLSVGVRMRWAKKRAY